MRNEINLAQKTGKPSWLRRRIPSGENYQWIRHLLKDSRLNTVCEAALCPNMGECYSEKTAAFLILGNRCTRNCGFCAINHGTPNPPDVQEPERIAKAVGKLGLDYVVLTSVTRDDLPDGGGKHFADTIRAIRRQQPGTLIEVLIPDFQNTPDGLQQVIVAGPNVLNHNLETVPRLYPDVRPQADYLGSLEVLKRVRESGSEIQTKSGLILGLGEQRDEIHKTLEDLIRTGCRMLTLGQYLQPSKHHLPVERFVPPREFDDWRKAALDMGFAAVASGPFVRSSYHAKGLYQKRK